MFTMPPCYCIFMCILSSYGTINTPKEHCSQDNRELKKDMTVII